MSNKLLALLILLLTYSSHAEIYTWVDENGKKHFGDKVPPEYQEQINAVEVDVRQPSPEELVRARAIATEQAKAVIDSRNSRAANMKPEHKVPESSEPALTAEQYAKTTCERKKQLYKESEDCYSKCTQQNVLRSPGSLRVVKHVRNTSNCGHCQDYKKPNC